MFIESIDLRYSRHGLIWYPVAAESALETTIDNQMKADSSLDQRWGGGGVGDGKEGKKLEIY